MERSARGDMVIQQLRAALGPNSVLEGDAVRERPVSRLIQEGCAAKALVRPRSTEEVATVLRICHAAGQPVVPRAGMTGLVGGTMVGPDEIALSLELMSRIEELDPVAQTITVEAGVPLEAVQTYAADRGFLFPLDIGARGSATIGGNIATNAGGNKVLRYGMTRDMVLGLEAVLPDGTVVSSMFKILKNNTGLDLKQLFIGTEGTLGVVTRAVLRLRSQPSSQQTVLAAFPDFASVAQTLIEMQEKSAGTLSSYEIMWQDYYHLITEPGRRPPPLSRGYTFYALIEWEGADAEGDRQRFEAALEHNLEQGRIIDAVIAQSVAERQNLWRIRDDVHYLKTLDPLFVFDVSLAIPAMEGYVESLRNELTRRFGTATLIAYGHLGDGNLHIAASCGTVADKAVVEQLVYAPLAAMRGSISAEHGIGLDKRKHLPMTRAPEEVALMRTIKRAIDPGNILNPGKIYG